ncbi:MAG: methyltransferase [Rhizobiaceae bacterium]|nr:MAG: methyltransferase [Rhizobiaceae bacterium]CAG0953949.1 Ribosomal protein L11 methyltransferase [Rhizobiaceae bacterium]
MTECCGGSDPLDEIRCRLRVAPVPGLPGLLLYCAHPGSGLGQIAGGGASPYWAYPWAGGLALARYLADHPSAVAGSRVVDLGSGSGLVAIAAAKAGARAVLAADVDRHAVAAIGLNAALNGVAVATCRADLTDGPPPDADIVLAGDVFYAAEVAAKTGAYLAHCAAAGLAVFVGDPGRAYLPIERLSRCAEYDVSDFGDGRSTTRAAVYRLDRLPA